MAIIMLTPFGTSIIAHPTRKLYTIFHKKHINFCLRLMYLTNKGMVVCQKQNIILTDDIISKKSEKQQMQRMSNMARKKSIDYASMFTLRADGRYMYRWTDSTGRHCLYDKDA